MYKIHVDLYDKIQFFIFTFTLTGFGVCPQVPKGYAFYSLVTSPPGREVWKVVFITIIDAWGASGLRTHTTILQAAGLNPLVNRVMLLGIEPRS